MNIAQLEAAFSKDPDPSSTVLRGLARANGVNVQEIEQWFKERRAMGAPLQWLAEVRTVSARDREQLLNLKVQSVRRGSNHAAVQAPARQSNSPPQDQPQDPEVQHEVQEVQAPIQQREAFERDFFSFAQAPTREISARDREQILNLKAREPKRPPQEPEVRAPVQQAEVVATHFVPARNRDRNAGAEIVRQQMDFAEVSLTVQAPATPGTHNPS